MTTFTPYRAEVVGSYLRPAEIKQARKQFEAGEIDAAALRRVEDDAIRQVVARQRESGLQVVTDGEFRRAWWHFDFFDGLDGVERYEAEQGIQFNGVQTKARGVKVTGKLGFSDHPMLDDFRFLQSISGDAVAKMTIPSPSVLHFRGGRKVIDADVYPDLDVYFDDLARTYRDAINAFYKAGCRYLQLDDTVWAYLCSDDQKQQIRERGDDPEALARTYARVLNKAIEGKPDDLVIGLHVCRGNFRSTWISEGGYEPVAEILFGGVNIDAFFLEYDNERSGGFEPLRFIKPGKQQVVLGLVTTKTGELEAVETVEKRLHEAARFVSLDQLCLSPQCGFASTEEGNSLTEEQQWAKVRLVVEAASRVW
ncbi:5-methyltetrahydropteroyltriglutamate--homocysteine S-methyltransferase [Erwinia persicina]|uniref:cobalamin-independent methionine synthase II family protein n=1 Tax=Erwinia persicina TaxID=55211 RepID=UPI000E4AAEB0|nr:cobalamin-independent methionine synthase II family protein [Erwinia persicina]AXU96181.1 5-methyltetrahydropteroyltriglutamate--homocysteine S-methyltransferase [Erwinia persicina]MCQ4094658.1 cobalamin-independent methionine synthase II family protein [Erwinia persicina]MCQ4102627.1 cobalamin-independent methionine synthase II family protein [Erwinia persicina]QZQ49354.1 cobalamin-independent methionine synthase II family protein [Erwinia persicina]HBI08039.1 5-methyltetrahydropteroyltrig